MNGDEEPSPSMGFYLQRGKHAARGAKGKKAHNTRGHTSNTTTHKECKRGVFASLYESLPLRRIILIVGGVGQPSGI